MSMTRTSRYSAAHRADITGATMVEAMVALVVLSVGMLGIASLYATTLQAGRTALVRTQAVTQVNDMIDRIRANALARDAYDLSKSNGGKPVSQGCVAGADNCSCQKLAQDDLATWIAATRDAVPGTTGMDVKVKLAAATGRPDQYLVRVEWKGAGDTQTLSYQGNLNLIPVLP
jgi:type IV pilus assembly protein PilV